MKISRLIWSIVLPFIHGGRNSLINQISHVMFHRPKYSSFGSDRIVISTMPLEVPIEMRTYLRSATLNYSRNVKRHANEFALHRVTMLRNRMPSYYINAASISLPRHSRGNYTCGGMAIGLPYKCTRRYSDFYLEVIHRPLINCTGGSRCVIRIISASDFFRDHESKGIAVSILTIQLTPLFRGESKKIKLHGNSQF